MNTRAWFLAPILLSIAACGADEGNADPLRVPPADAAGDLPDPARPGAGDSGAIWVEDQDGAIAGVLVRRGSDDHVADRSIYDLVTVFHPASGLFYEVTMSDGVVRNPHTVFFKGYDCDTPIGISAGACVDCRVGYGVAVRHDGRWWQTRGGATFEQLGPGSTVGGGVTTECVAHGTTNAKGFRLDAVGGQTPPAAFSPPLRFAFR